MSFFKTLIVWFLLCALIKMALTASLNILGISGDAVLITSTMFSLFLGTLITAKLLKRGAFGNETDTGDINRLKPYANFGIFGNVVAVVFLAVVAFNEIDGYLSSEDEIMLLLFMAISVILFFCIYIIWSHFYSEAWKLRRELKILQLQKEVDNLETSIANQSGGELSLIK